MSHCFASTDALRRSVISDLHRFHCPLLAGTSPCVSRNSSSMDNNSKLSNFFDRLLFCGDEPERANLIEWLLYSVTKATALPSNDPEATLAVLVSLRVASADESGLDLVSGAAPRHNQLVMYSRLLELMKLTLGVDSNGSIASSFSVSTARPVFSSTPANSFCGSLDTSVSTTAAASGKVRRHSNSSNSNQQQQQQTALSSTIASMQQFLHQVCSGSLSEDSCRRSPFATTSSSREHDGVRRRLDNDDDNKTEPELPLPPHLRHVLACRMAETERELQDEGDHQNQQQHQQQQHPVRGGATTTAASIGSLRRRLRAGIDSDADLLERLRQRRQNRPAEQAAQADEVADSEDTELVELRDAVELRSTIVELRMELARLVASMSASYPTTKTSTTRSLPEADTRLDNAVRLASEPLSEFVQRSLEASRTAETVAEIRGRLRRLRCLGVGGAGGVDGVALPEPMATLSLLASSQEI